MALQVAFEEGRGAYGCRRAAAQLNRDGHLCSVGLAADLMRELGLRACQPRACKRTTVPGQEPVTSADLIARDFTAATPGQRLVGDITYLKTGEGWLYLATVTGLATRMVTGWQLAEHMRTGLVTDALAMAITGGHAAPGAIDHPLNPSNTPRPSSPGSARPTPSAPAPAAPGCAGTTPPPRASWAP